MFAKILEVGGVGGIIAIVGVVVIAIAAYLFLRDILGGKDE